MNILSLEWSVILDRVDSKKFEAVVLGWSSPIMSDPYQLWHSDNANVNNSSNYISFANPEADAIINEMRQCFDSKRRLELYHEFHRLIHEEEPYLFLFSSSSLTAISSRYQNLREFPLGHQKMILWTPRENQMKMNDL